MTAIEKLINIASAEVGYLEKKTKDNLDRKTSNAGNANYTKYWRDIKPSYQGQPWCACFITWCFVQAFGVEITTKLLKHFPYVYCPAMASLFTLNKTPKVGDIVIFYRNGQFVHTGLVKFANGNVFKTIEGNTSGGSSIVANGGGVFEKTYNLSNLLGTKFVTPNWKIIETVSTQSDNSIHWGEKYKNILKSHNLVSDNEFWSFYDSPTPKPHTLALLDKYTGGTWVSEEADSNTHWVQPYVYSLCGKGVISDKTVWLTNPDDSISKAQLLALVAKIANNGTNELAEYENNCVDHWGRNYLNFLCDKSIIDTPEVWCDDFEAEVSRANVMALVCKAFSLK